MFLKINHEPDEALLMVTLELDSARSERGVVHCEFCVEWVRSGSWSRGRGGRGLLRSAGGRSRGRGGRGGGRRGLLRSVCVCGGGFGCGLRCERHVILTS